MPVLWSTPSHVSPPSALHEAYCVILLLSDYECNASLSRGLIAECVLALRSHQSCREAHSHTQGHILVTLGDKSSVFMLEIQFPAHLCLSVTDYNSSDQKTACRRHELYVSFSELGWQVAITLFFHTTKQVVVCLLGASLIV